MADLILVTRVERPAPGTRLWGPNNRLLTEAEITGLVSIYWPANEVAHAKAVSLCESGLWTGAWAWEKEDSRGLFQINVEAHADMGQYDLFDAQINCYWAHALWAAQGWGPWTCAHVLHIV